MTRLRKKLGNLAIAIKTRNINDAHKYAKNTILILAGISISTLTNTRIFEKVQEAKRKTEEAELKQNIKLEEYENELDEHIRN